MTDETNTQQAASSESNAPPVQTSAPAQAAPPSQAAPPKRSRVKTFFEHISEWFEDHLGEAQSVEQTAAISLSVFTPGLGLLLTMVAGEPFAAKVSAVIAKVQTSLANAGALLNGAEAGDATHSVKGFLTDVQTNLGTLLADADIKNSKKVQEITGVVNALIGEVEAVLGATADHQAPIAGAAKVA